VWAHVGGFVTGVLLVKLFDNRSLVSRRVMISDARGVWQRWVGRQTGVWLGLVTVA
jgi:hypothetical protein